MVKGFIESPRCMRCDHELNEVESFYNEVGGKEYHCPYCGAIEIFYPCDEENQKDFPFYSDVEDVSSSSNCSYGYDGLCPQCGSHIVWGSDFMRSEILGDVDEDILDEWGCQKDDALASSVHCPHCGASIDIIEAKPSEYHLYPAYKLPTD